jgi:hypothetical protein
MPEPTESSQAPAWSAVKPKAARLVLGQLTGVRGPAPGVVEERRLDTDERRRHSAWSFLYGGFRPRRRSGRRNEDHHQIFLDWHEPRLLYLGLAVLLMSCADALFTLNILAGGGEELNGIMDHLIGSDIAQFLGVKIGLTAMSVIVLVMLANRRFLGRVSVVRLLQFFCVGYFVLMAYEIYLLFQITAFQFGDASAGLADLL